MSEFGYGVAILSESKYGFACHGNVLRISLLRAATEPDAEQDQGMQVPEEVIAVIDSLVSGLHDFSWAVLPHVGHFLESDVPIAAYLYNSPLHRTLLPAQTLLLNLESHSHTSNSSVCSRRCEIPTRTEAPGADFGSRSAQRNP